MKKDKRIKGGKEERGKEKKKYLLRFTQVVPQRMTQLYNCEIPHFSNYLDFSSSATLYLNLSLQVIQNIYASLISYFSFF